MFYTIYKITNIINNKIYVGKHQTKELNDGYMGSGKHLKSAQNKYGIENFRKEILFHFDNEADMNAKEAELVTEEFCLREDTYNLCPGGNGGFGYLNWTDKSNIGWKTNGNPEAKIRSTKGGLIHKYRLETDAEYKQKFVLRSKKYLDPKAFLGKTHTEETKRTIGEINSKHQMGSGNSQYGTCWITDGHSNKKIKKTDPIPEGWRTGRKKLCWHACQQGWHTEPC